jgi:P-type Na+/K+ transporter
VSGQCNKPMSKPAHALDRETLVKELGADAENGYSKSQANDKLNEFGRNELDDGPGVQPIKILIRQVANAMMLVLIMAMVVSFAIKSWIEGGVVAAVIALNIIVGFLQEFQAEKTMDSLRSLSSPTANVVRDGSTINVPTAEIVVGDLVELKVGDTVPADLRYVNAVLWQLFN